MESNTSLGFEAYLDGEGVLKGLQKLAKQLPYAESVALNRTANTVRDALKVEIKKDFDRPTNRTINATWVQYSSKEQSERHVLIGLSDKKTGKNTVTPAQYLAPQIEGGKRNQKRSERAVTDYTAFPAMGGKGKKFMVPAKVAKLDAYGNMPGSQWTKILSEIKGLSEVGFQGNRTRGSKTKRGGFFISKTKPLILQKQGDRAVPILVGVSSVTYKPRLPWYEVIEKVWNANIEKEAVKAIGEAVASAFTGG